MKFSLAPSQFLSLFLGVAVAAGCGAPKASDKDGSTDDCEFDVDCHNGQVCVSKVCVAPGDGGDAGQEDAGPPDAGPEDAGPVVPVTVTLTGCPFIGFQVPVKVGDQTFQMSVDTGSTTTAVAGSGCSNCGVTPEYTLDSTGIATGAQCSSQYGSGEWSGVVDTDMVQVGGEMPAVKLDFGVMKSQNQFFIDGDCEGNPGKSASQGILGMGPLDLSALMMGHAIPADAYFNDLVQTANLPDVFAVELCSTGGKMWFGGYDPSQASGAAQYTPMVNNGYYGVQINSMSLGMGTGTTGNLNLDGSDPGAVVDTGTWGFYMPTRAFTTMTNNLSSTTSALYAAATTAFGAGALDANFFSQGNCITAATGMTQADVDATMPPLTMTMPAVGGGPDISITIPATQSYLVPITSGGTTCYTAGVGDNSMLGGQTIMGASALRGYITIFDVGGDSGNGQVGFAPQTQCH